MTVGHRSGRDIGGLSREHATRLFLETADLCTDGGVFPVGFAGESSDLDDGEYLVSVVDCWDPVEERPRRAEIGVERFTGAYRFVGWLAE